MKHKWKIGIDARMFSDSFTGIGRYTFELTKRFFARNDLPIQWVLFLNEPEFSKCTFFAPDVKTVCVNSPHYSFSEQTKFLRILNQEKCDLVHFTHFNVPILYTRPFITTIHDTTISFYPGKRMNSWWRRTAYNKVMKKAVFDSEKVITVSENTKKDVVKLFKVDESKIIKIWNGVGDEFQPHMPIIQDTIRGKYGLSEKFLLYTGVWREHKNLVRLIEAFGKIIDRASKKSGPSKLHDLQLVITGKEDLNYPEVKEMVRKLKLTDKVKFVGLVSFDDLIVLYGAASAFVFPSLYEGFGLPPIEAMECDTPVVASNVSSIPEVCGDAVQYFNPIDTDDMASQIIKVLSDEGLRKELVEKGRERVKLFSWDKAAEETLKIYHSVLQ